MKTRKTIWIFSLIIALGVAAIHNSCKKSSSDPDPNTVTDINGNVYHYITIGNQVWMVENLKTTKFNDGTSIPLGPSDASWGNLRSPAYCLYDNNNGKYGALYNWYSVNTGKLAPKGWHVPTDTDWNNLIAYLGGDGIAGGKMKSTGTIKDGNGLWSDPNIGATNESGFTALPAGYRLLVGTYMNIDYSFSVWSSTGNSEFDAWSRLLLFNKTEVSRDSDDKGMGLSVRCIRD